MEIHNIRQLLPFVEQKPEFVVLQKDGYQVIDYVYQDQGTFDIPELMECRGIKFCPEGLILARPFRKFFNYGERGADLPSHRPHVITEKLDGSMVHPVLLGRRMFFMTRKGHTDVAMKAERHVLSAPGYGYQDFCHEAVDRGFTPIFEYTSPNNRIVLRYEEDTLTLLAMRHMVSGDFIGRETLEAWGRRFSVPVVRRMDFSLKGDVQQFIKTTRELVDAEGYVIYFDDGYMVKIKAEDYVLKHRALDDLGSKKKVVALCAQGFMDDVLPILSEADADELMAFNHDLQQEIAGYMDAVSVYVSVYRKMEQSDKTTARKRFAVDYAYLTEKHNHLRSAAFASIDGKDPRLVIVNHLIRNPDTVVTKWRGE